MSVFLRVVAQVASISSLPWLGTPSTYSHVQPVFLVVCYIYLAIRYIWTRKDFTKIRFVIRSLATKLASLMAFNWLNQYFATRIESYFTIWVACPPASTICPSISSIGRSNYRVRSQLEHWYSFGIPSQTDPLEKLYILKQQRWLKYNTLGQSRIKHFLLKTSSHHTQLNIR